jgi:hypothetical protein
VPFLPAPLGRASIEYISLVSLGMRWRGHKKSCDRVGPSQSRSNRDFGQV